MENSSSLINIGKKCLIVTGRNSAVSSGALDDVIKIFDANDIEYKIFNEIEPNPLTETCRYAGALASEFVADYILGIGGGSVLDAAKAVAIYCENPHFSHSDIYNRVVPVKHLPVVLIGTTAGTGSEVTGVSVLTSSETGLKKSISGSDCYADIAFCDYSYTKSTNTDVRISTALDALAHSIEAFVASSSNELVELYSERAIKLLSPYILTAKFDNLTDSDFEIIYMASLYAGLAINIAGTCFPHTVGYYLTECHNIPHGKACAAFMPILLEKTKKYCPEKFEAILKIINVDIDLFLSAVKKLSAVKVSFSRKDAEETSLRWKNGVKNFDRSPGGFSYIDAKEALISLIS
ncbi:MAG: iron-containing alcohol dehydrogenase [Clostridia bacterium]|nr:iron-containing alcohol dehydrogenase [Clostridia bacterium]